MAEPAIRRITVGEFLRWEDGTDTRYELVDGFVVAMAPAAPRHGALVLRLGGAINATLRGRPSCAAYGEAGIVRPDRDDTFYVADIAVNCDRLQPDDQMICNPILIVEVLSPSTANFDRNTKVPDYRRIPSVEEILLLDSTTMFAEILQHDGDRWITEIVQGPAATLSLNSVPLTISMAELYEGLPLPETAGQHGPASSVSF
jgi:Uma2 family endonuclease